MLIWAAILLLVARSKVLFVSETLYGTSSGIQYYTRECAKVWPGGRALMCTSQQNVSDIIGNDKELVNTRDAMMNRNNGSWSPLFGPNVTLHALLLDENGFRHDTAIAAITGCDEYGKLHPNQTCSDWSVNNKQRNVAVGNISTKTGNWIYDSNIASTCTGSAMYRVLCLGEFKFYFMRSSPRMDTVLNAFPSTINLTFSLRCTLQLPFQLGSVTIEGGGFSFKVPASMLTTMNNTLTIGAGWEDSFHRCIDCEYTVMISSKALTSIAQQVNDEVRIKFTVLTGKPTSEPDQNVKLLWEFLIPVAIVLACIIGMGIYRRRKYKRMAAADALSGHKQELLTRRSQDEDLSWSLSQPLSPGKNNSRVVPINGGGGGISRGNSRYESGGDAVGRRKKQFAIHCTTTTDSVWEISPKDLVLGKIIGQGGAGVVYAGRYFDQPVAIKRLYQQFVLGKSESQLTQEGGGGEGEGDPKNNDGTSSNNNNNNNNGGETNEEGGDDDDHDELEDVQNQAIREFFHEAQVWTRLRFKNIVQLYGISSQPKQLMMVMELCENSLFDLLHKPHRNNNDLPWSRRLNIAKEIVSGVMYLHRQNVLHRDLKSMNVLLNQGVVKICDFGMAKLKSNAGVTMSTSVGSPQWMAPDVLGGAEWTAMADVYSFGIILWEIAFRIPPYSDFDSNIFALCDQIRAGLRPRVDIGDPQFPTEDFGRKYLLLTQRSWDGEPSARPTFKEILGEINLLISDLDGGISQQQEEKRITAESLVGESMARLSRGEIDRAVELLNESIDLYPTSGAFSRLWGLHMDRLEYNNAQAVAERLCALSPEIGYERLGDTFSQQYNLQDAVAMYSKALTYDPYNTDIKKKVQRYTALLRKTMTPTSAALVSSIPDPTLSVGAAGSSTSMGTSVGVGIPTSSPTIDMGMDSTHGSTVPILHLPPPHNNN